APVENMNGNDVTSNMAVMKNAIDPLPIDDLMSLLNEPEQDMMTLPPCDLDEGADGTTFDLVLCRYPFGRHLRAVHEHTMLSFA
ncbi:MAG: hypothetical protein LLG16_00235, partial [Euryarchaeota archaeon]|nr:hypothetical protein [Euryarchaeota archaeon]